MAEGKYMGGRWNDPSLSDDVRFQAALDALYFERMRSAVCEHEKPRFLSSGRERTHCFDCLPKRPKFLPRKDSKGKVTRYDKNCLVCGIAFRGTLPQKYCGQNCNSTARNRREGILPKAEAQAKRREQSKNNFDCEQCGKRFHRGVSKTNIAGGYASNRFCSIACNSAWRIEQGRAKRLGTFSELRWSRCKHCDKQFIQRRTSLFCSDSCRRKQYRVDAAEFNKQKMISSASQTRHCVQCGVWFSRMYGNKRRTCSEECQLQNKRDLQKSCRELRRRRLNKCSKRERVVDRKVLERDGWRCKWCGVSTPASLRGTYEDNAPEVDHIIPVSKGGAHTYENVQCLCRRCNGIKADHIVAVMDYGHVADARHIPAHWGAV